jgi:hypothetical protein
VIATSISTSAALGALRSLTLSPQLTYGEPLAHGDERRVGKTAKLIALHTRLTFRPDGPQSSR